MATSSANQKPTPEQKIAQLRRRGWSEVRIEQYMKDWRFHIPPTRSPHGRKALRQR